MVCLVCQADYQRMRGVQRFKKDYGYCSLECLQASKSPCPACQSPIVHRDGEAVGEFFGRAYCTVSCSAVHATRGPKSAETRARMSQAARDISPQKREALSVATRAWQQTPEGRIKVAKTRAAARVWRSEHEAEFQVKRLQTLNERGWPAEWGARLRAFYQTPEGVAQREQFRQKYTGRRRPVRISEAVRAALRRFWDSAEGYRLREELSHRRTNDPSRTPYGPGWRQQAARIRFRDKCCRLCGVTESRFGAQLDVHHIYSRQLFGYHPGQNQNYRWANHPANLIALCHSCHIKVEKQSAAVPEDYQHRADILWHEFIGESAT